MKSPPPKPLASAAPAKRARAPAFQIALLTGIALALYVGIRQLPTGTNLSHLDFRVSNGNSIEFCDPANPQFIPVVAVQSPVTMRVAGSIPAVAGQSVRATATFVTASGKPIGPEDLLVTHTEKLHLLVFDPALRDYQHVHPTPGAKPGDWSFTFTPHDSGRYRVFADFTPAATGRGLYASADLDVAPGPGGASAPKAPEMRRAADGALEVERDGLVFSLLPKTSSLKARQISDFSFAVRRASGGPVKLEPVMDAYAHLVAVDSDRSGFAHLHPTQLTDPAKGEAAVSMLEFKVTIPQAGRYVIWAQVRIDGRDEYAPFWFDVKE
ncbi:hypothetical protein DB347_10670 [Opitutaceae bacterium EW11]|nr:hypothetical protein DB347_10670 [Opitutaceae bacterium EW11]